MSKVPTRASLHPGLVADSVRSGALALTLLGSITFDGNTDMASTKRGADTSIKIVEFNSVSAGGSNEEVGRHIRSPTGFNHSRHRAAAFAVERREPPSCCTYRIAGPRTNRLRRMIVPRTAPE